MVGLFAPVEWLERVGLPRPDHVVAVTTAGTGAGLVLFGAVNTALVASASNGTAIGAGLAGPMA